MTLDREAQQKEVEPAWARLFTRSILHANNCPYDLEEHECICYVSPLFDAIRVMLQQQEGETRRTADDYAEVEAQLARCREAHEMLMAAVEHYMLWEPGRAGHAAAHQTLRVALAESDIPPREPNA